MSDITPSQFPVGTILQDSAELAAMIGSEEETRAILGDGLTLYIRTDSNAQTVIVPASQLRENGFIKQCRCVSSASLTRNCGSF